MAEHEKRLVFEATRRYLDIRKTINKKWPLINKLVCVKEGRDRILDVFDLLHEKVVSYPNVQIAALNIYKNIVMHFSLLLSLISL